MRGDPAAAAPVRRLLGETPADPGCPVPGRVVALTGRPGGGVRAWSRTRSRPLALHPDGRWAEDGAVVAWPFLGFGPDGSTLHADGAEAVVVDAAGREHARWAPPAVPGFAPTLLSGCATDAGDVVVVVELGAPDGTWRYGLLVAAGGPPRWLAEPGTVVSGPATVRPGGSGRLCVADGFAQQVFELTLDARVTWSYGQRRWPGREPGRLRSPQALAPAGDDAFVVCDTMNHRVLVVDRAGVVGLEYPGPGAPAEERIASPHAAWHGADGLLLVADSGNGRVLALDRAGAVRGRWGAREPFVGALSYPRSAQPLPDGGVLVADTARHRVVELGPAGDVRWRYGGGDPGDGPGALDWPRSARRGDDGLTWVADGLNSRFVAVSPAGEQVRELRAVRLPDGGPLDVDGPHFARPMPDGTVLLVDSGRPAVLRVDPSGRVVRSYGLRPDEPLADPHCVVEDAEGRLVVSDSGRERVVVLGPDGPVGEWRCAPGPAAWAYPRGLALVAGLLLVGDEKGDLWALRPDRGAVRVRLVAESPVATRLGGIRDLEVGDGVLLVTDYEHHRVAEVALPELLAAVEAAAPDPAGPRYHRTGPPEPDFGRTDGVP